MSLIAALGWLPWTVWGVQMLLEEWQRSRGTEEQGRGFRYFFTLQRSSYAGIILVAVSLGMQLVTHTLPVIYSVYLLGAMVVWQAVAGWSEEARRRGGEERASSAGGKRSRSTFHVSRFTHHASRITFHPHPHPSPARPAVGGAVGSGATTAAAGIGRIQQPLPEPRPSQ
ncbi:MAG: hypothetical protein HC875_16590 [Anaerolineales bacterium]|nr:hypothetical protein [Anaerolineales bacterium]